ncbi:glutathione peroxidase [Paroceanicella profunda]|uniref:Glutathione peroxidase n=1 Tax=Paroceanicella profunda TaxID=2579971 RepID=A0A5B8FZK9_9RHOB|nr:glutathione peroxidase [Paroceanicella profunda]QDL92229.1 glutathione peroxidase [Paroceanicella profunda]
MTRRSLQTGAMALTLSALAGMAEADTAFDHRFTALTGGEISMADFAGKAVLVVNTASMCGYTYQYQGLQDLADRYGARGLVVLGVPSDDFRQEFNSADEVKDFCEVNFSITFPMTDIEHVTGEDAHPFYRWAAVEGGAPAVPRWNFHKLLIAPDGSLAASFPTRTKPEDPEVAARIEAVLPGS